MVRPSSKNNSNNSTEAADVKERKRLKKLSFSNHILSDTPIDAQSPLPPSKTVLKHHGKDITRKCQRKNRFLFSFPGLLAPIASGGKIGDLKNLGTKNPILYLHFPQGQLKLFGTIVYPKNRYLSLQFSRGGKNVMCEDYFDTMIVFSEAWWIGTKEENPEEARLDFPKQFLEGREVEYDFKGGAGAASALINKQVAHRSGMKYVEEESPDTELENDLLDEKSNLKDLKETTPVRHSERTTGKTFKFADVSSEEDAVESVPADIDVKEEGEEEKKVKSITSSTIVLDFDDEDATQGNHFSSQNHASAMSETNSRKLSESAVIATTSKEDLHSNRGSLVQATISTLFNKAHGKKKVEEKIEPRNSRKYQSSKGFYLTVAGQKSPHADLKRKNDQAGEPIKRGKVTRGKKAETGIEEKKKVYEVDDEDIEEFSSSTQGTEGSDEDWEA
ncbi:DNA-binding protein RHL1 isoform X2 [Ricinus communis]|uniref:DNA-binding protein RHL1 isoform X2 n=1 Tax=Ricinus communis TaxID=3988 RepID=UPI000772AF8B|nr:DNA-binding protein RHL1 isoform X2 [Ricinus communis]|eukprot:XP_015581412.1 DNA-binding protein RHL1 isoform X2 [Ricinus communis]